MTMAHTQRVALVTGASSGIGKVAALRLREAGFVVYGVARRTDRMQDLRDHGVRTLAMDVTDDVSTGLGVKQILDEAGRIDVLVNNAGYGSYGASRTGHLRRLAASSR
jgi:NADP-dependent 3-hydroxy acid dehydrogenase YdfG